MLRKLIRGCCLSLKNLFVKKSNKNNEEISFINGKHSFRLNLIVILCVNFALISFTCSRWYLIAHPRVIGASPVWLGHYGPPIGLIFVSIGVLVFSLLERMVIDDKGISSRLMKQEEKESWCWNNIEKIEYAPIISYIATDNTIVQCLKKVVVKRKDGKTKTVYLCLWEKSSQLYQTFRKYAEQNNVQEHES